MKNIVSSNNKSLTHVKAHQVTTTYMSNHPCLLVRKTWANQPILTREQLSCLLPTSASFCLLPRTIHVAWQALCHKFGVVYLDKRCLDCLCKYAYFNHKQCMHHCSPHSHTNCSIVQSLYRPIGQLKHLNTIWCCLCTTAQGATRAARAVMTAPARLPGPLRAGWREFGSSSRQLMHFLRLRQGLRSQRRMCRQLKVLRNLLGGSARPASSGPQRQRQPLRVPRDLHKQHLLPSLLLLTWWRAEPHQSRPFRF